MPLPVARFDVKKLLICLGHSRNFSLINIVRRRPAAPSVRLSNSLCRSHSVVAYSSIRKSMVGGGNGCGESLVGNGDTPVQCKEITIPVPWGHLAGNLILCS